MLTVDFTFTSFSTGLHSSHSGTLSKKASVRNMSALHWTKVANKSAEVWDWADGTKPMQVSSKSGEGWTNCSSTWTLTNFTIIWQNLFPVHATGDMYVIFHLPRSNFHFPNSRSVYQSFPKNYKSQYKTALQKSISDAFKLLKKITSQKSNPMPPLENCVFELLWKWDIYRRPFCGPNFRHPAVCRTLVPSTQVLGSGVRCPPFFVGDFGSPCHVLNFVNCFEEALPSTSVHVYLDLP